MGESIDHIATVSPEADLGQVRAYLQILRTEDLNLYENARGMLDDVLFYNTPDHHTGEIYTEKTIDALQEYSDRPSPETRFELTQWQIATAIHVVRGMIQGKKLPIEQFGTLIGDVRDTMIAIDGGQKSNKQHDKRIRGEITDVWSFASSWRSLNADPVSMRRAAEAYKQVGHSWVFDRMMGRVALVEKQRLTLGR